MAMLADRRQRKRYNLVPRGKALYEDSNRFGTKMLEKMGWSKGKGLGAKEDGDKEFVRIKYKNDSIGLGFEDRDDQWTQHETEFNGLLKNLTGGEVEDTEAADITPAVGFGFKSEEPSLVEKFKHSGESLEEKSKKSRARVHYKKFTRGKDLSRYSEKDLANIFGKKSFDNGESQPNSSENNTPKEQSDDESDTKTNFGVQMINSGTSISDYFKSKMEALKKQKLNFVQENSQDTNSMEQSEDSGEGKSKKNKKKRDKTRELDDTVECQETIDNSSTGIEKVAEKSKKKKKKDKSEDINEQQSTELELETPEQTQNAFEEKPKKKKKKDKLKQLEEYSEISATIVHETLEQDIQSKKSKKLKSTSLGEALESEVSCKVDISESLEQSQDKITNKSKKKKNTDKSKLLEENVDQEIDQKSTDTELEIPEQQSDVLEKSSKKKKRKHFEEINNPDYAEHTIKCKKPKSKNIPQSGDMLNGHINNSESENGGKIPKENSSDDTNGNNITKSGKKKRSKNNSNEPSDTVQQTNSIQKKHKINDSRQLHDTTLTTPLNKSSSANNSPDIFKINYFLAEKYFQTNLNSFKGSNIKDIIGYGLSSNLELKIEKSRTDDYNIAKLYGDVFDKYAIIGNNAVYVGPQKQTKKNYVRSIKKKNVFTII